MERVSHSDLLEKGLATFKKVLEQSVNVNREQMLDLLNFEIAVNAVVTNLKAVESMTSEELIEMAKKNLGERP